MTIVALGLASLVLLGCRPAPEVEATRRPASVTWMPGDLGRDAGADEDTDDDTGEDTQRCAEDPEAPGCPWARSDAAFGDEGVWANRDPGDGPQAPAPEPCPDSAVLGDLIEVAAGPFEMGCDEADSELCGTAERGRRHVEVAAFAIDRTEVTQAAYARCIDAGVCSPPAGGFEPRGRCTHPVVNVTWEQASQYCAWLDKRLPTEAEWEKAARGSDGRRFPWGDDAPTCELANFAGCGLRDAEAVASHPTGASPYGVLDLAGNVREWVFDSQQGRARQPKRAIRGGMFTDRAMHLRAARRSYGDVSVSDLGIGFRCAR